ncbi:synaptic vesicle glycoprotein 2B [Musca vetustissima]|uniref:synaptic vesicle glycoprotein 2B n=1 Tax=Musca vetustissima TaxID=27455 RepID=UPI002AB63B06|nr:synaptic vesicle glycoprotein 2B [Musca vetustissima]
MKREKNANGGTIVPSHTFEEAISLLPIGKFHYKLLLVGGLCFLTVMVEIMCVSIILPSMRCDLESTVAEQGILASAGFLGIVLSSHGMGFLADTWGRVKTLRLAFTLACISTAISAFSVNIWMLIVFRFISGFVISGGQACVFSLAGEFHGNRTRTRHVTLLSGFLPLSLVYLPTMATFILPLQIDTMLLGMKFSSWRILILTNCILSLLTLFGLYFIPETPKYMLVQGDNNAALETLRWIFTKNTGKPATEFPVQHITPQTGGANLANIGGVKDAVKMIWSQTKPLFAKERYLHTINICIINMAVYCISQGLFMWFPTLLNAMVASNAENPLVCYTLVHLNDGSNTGASDVCNGHVDIFPFLIIILVGAAFTLFYLFFSFTIDLIGKKNLILTWLVVSGICVTLLHWTTNFYVIVTLLTFTMSVGNVGGLVSTISMEFFPTNINAMGMCFIMMLGRVGAVLGSNFIGVLLFNYCDNTFWAMTAACLILLVMSWFLPERKYNKKKVIHPTTG